MSNSTAPAAANELVLFISEVVKDRYRRTGCSTNGAALAQAIRRRYPTLSYQQLGLDRLGDAVRLAERDGFVTRHVGVKHLELSPGPASGIAAGIPPPCTNKSYGSKYVRPEIWKALVFYRPGLAHYFDRTTARVQEIDTGTQARGIDQYANNPRWVKIPNVPAQLQKEWMREFLALQNLPGAEMAPVDGEYWWQEFPKWLETYDPALKHQWLEYRSRHVTAYAEKWAQDNLVSVEALFSTTSPREKPFPLISRRHETRPDGPALASTVNLHAETENLALRKAVLAAIAEMDTHELLGLSIPIRCILRHFKAL